MKRKWNSRLFFVACNKVVAILSAIGQRLFSVQDAVLERDHHFIKFAEQRHEFGNIEISRIGADGTAGNAVVAGTFIRLPDKIHLEGGRVFRLFFWRIPFGVLDDALFVLCLALVRIQVGLGKIPYDRANGASFPAQSPVEFSFRLLHTVQRK